MRIKPLSTDNLMARFLAGLARVVLRHPRLFLYPQLVLFAGGLVVTLKYPGIEFNTSRNDLVGANKKYHQNFLRLKKEFPTQDDLVVVVESEDGEKNRQFVDRLGAKLEAETNLFNHVFYKGDLKMLGSKALLLVPENDLADLRLILKDFQPFIAQFTRTTNLVSLFRLICTQFRTAKQEASEANESLLKALPALERIITQATDSLRRSGAPPSPGITALFDPGEEAQQQMYITFAQGRIYLVTAQAPTEELNTAAVLRLRELVEETKLEVLGINVGLTGEPVLELDEMAQSQKDTALASVVALALCALIFIYGYQETGRPVKATFCLIIGLGYTLGFATLVIGHLNILTITFMPILIGLAIDYGVHLISRYEEELRRGEAMETALTRAMVLTGQGILTGGLTTAGGFLAMGLTNFKGIQEMGIICGGGLVICLVPMMTLLPVLLLRGRQNVVDRQLSPAAERRAWIENLWLRRPVLTAGVTLALCGLAATQLRKVYFDYNLVNMQSKGLPAVEYEKALIASTPKSVLFGAVVATNLAQAGALERQLTNLSAVASVDSINGFLSEDQTRKLAVVGQIKQELAAVRFSEPDPRPVELQELSAVLYSLRGYLGAALDAVRAEQPELVPQFESLRDAIQALRKEMLRGNDRQVAANALKLAEFQRRLFLDIRDTFQALRTQDDRAPLSVADLPPALRDRFIGVTGKYLLMVYPRGDIWQREVQETFIRQVEKIYPDVTGTPVQLYYY
ncbi:MAG TPA: MMPL family transporter, partial [Verrucomicrobiota bacterium]|nr:MMPL family transporter [Verrucomicrobiota bacterium]